MHCVIPLIWHSGKGKTIGREINRWLPRAKVGRRGQTAKGRLQRGTRESGGWKYHMHRHCTMDTLVNITKLHPLKGWVRTSDFNKLEFKKKPVTPKQRHYFAGKGPYSQSYGFSSSHVWMWELHHKEDWAPKNWCFWTVVLKTTLEMVWAAWC